MAPKKMSLGAKLLIALVVIIAGAAAGFYFTGNWNMVTDYWQSITNPVPVEAPADAASAADAAPAEAAPAPEG